MKFTPTKRKFEVSSGLVRLIASNSLTGNCYALRRVASPCGICELLCIPMKMSYSVETDEKCQFVLYVNINIPMKVKAACLLE